MVRPSALDMNEITDLVAAGRTTEEIGAKLGVPVSTLLVLQNSMRSLVATAVECGVPAVAVAAFVGREIRTHISESIREAYATPEEGLTVLLHAEGGCVSVTEACKLFRKPRPVSSQALTEQIRKGSVIGYQTGGGQYLVPVWQFRPEGGVLKGLPEMLAAMRAKIPGAGYLTPFTFFLQGDPVTGGRTPLEVLRAGNLEQVMEAIEARAA
jgi:hypothetical protein